MPLAFCFFGFSYSNEESERGSESRLVLGFHVQSVSEHSGPDQCGKPFYDSFTTFRVNIRFCAKERPRNESGGLNSDQPEHKLGFSDVCPGACSWGRSPDPSIAAL